jgi:phosphoglycerol transferase
MLLLRPVALRPVRALAYLFAFVLICFGLWIHRTFGRPDLDQIAFHISLGVEGLSKSDPVLIRHFIGWCVVTPVVFSTAVLTVEKHGAAERLRSRLPSRLNTFAARVGAKMPHLLLAAALVYWVIDTSTVRYISKNFGVDYFGAHYIPPEKVQLQAGQTKNLVLIYVESLEAAYADAALFGTNRIAPLMKLKGERFARYRQAPGTGWTIAAIVATQCGVPLKRVGLFDVNTQGQLVDSILPRATCLGDILARRGYRNVFIGGASTRFGGKGTFMHGHHYHEVYGREEWIAQGVNPDDMNGWGLFDDDLMAKARAKVRELSATNQPFNLTLLTVDMHEPEGFRSRRCPVRRGEPEFPAIVQCSASAVADFVAWLRDHGYLENTNVVILGDHLARRNPATPILETLPERYIFNEFISKDPIRKNREEIVHFDLLPTILEFIGLRTPGQRVGLGFGALDAADVKPAPDRFEQMNENLLNRSDAYLKLWGH